ncbi:MAG TPA: rhodanese-like domain-containing protein [Patescibacteria group bacterium]|nr:rhodanese-like domain-containing protein [Patescibacteria group bacterium]
MQSNPKIIYLGIGLIVLVMAFTIFRPYIFNGGKKSVQKDASQKDENSINQISGNDLWNKMQNKEKIKLLDIRERDIFIASHLLDSENFTPESLTGAIDRMDKNTTYILVDELGDKSMNDLVKIFRTKGFRDVHYLAGGLANWRNENRQVMIDADPFSFQDQAKVKYITAEDLKNGLEKKPNSVIIDLRKDKSYAEGHIKDSINIYLGDLEARRTEVPDGKQLILVDNDGLWAFKGAVKLFDMGYMNVLALTEGLDKWKEKGYEIIK